jgi:hypothetical protein
MFFTYDQNNTGGSYIVDDSVSRYVIVEADTYQQANDIAESIGLYFDGSGDCDCCGNRWYAQYSDKDGTIMPEIGGEPINCNYRSVAVFSYPGEVFCRVYYAGMTIIMEHRVPYDDDIVAISSDGLV